MSRTVEFREHVAGLELRRYRPLEPARARVLWIHGAGEHGGRHAAEAARLARRGAEVWLPDLPGHGESAASFAWTPADLRAALAHLLAHAGAGPPFDLVGHSMGGLLAIGLVRELRLALRRCVLCAPFLAPARPIPRWKECAGRLAARLAPRMRFSLGLRGEDLLREPAEQQLWFEDPLRQRGIGARSAAALLDEAARRAAEVERFPVPCLVLIAGEDRVADPAVALRWAERCSASAVVLAGLRHEILREPERAIARLAIDRFLQLV
ncbi:MAG: alpha/beta fold hydrolase [Planctomycetes bacterium]|nr:alpha/beta fold hydrolase [Planctomycetota bacterium]